MKTKPFKIGVLSDGFRLPPLEGIKKAAEIGAQGVQIYTVAGDMSPAQMTSEDRRNLRALVDSLGITISAFCGDTGRGFGNPDLNPDTIEISKGIIDLAAEVGVPVITTHIGTVPEDRNDPVYKAMLNGVGAIADYAALKHVTLATETGPEKAPLLKQFLDEISSEGLGVNLDPANLVMCSADDPVAAVHTLAKYIVHTHAKDGKQISPRPNLKYQELPLGSGDVPWPEYLNALDEIGYKGFLTIEREAGADPAADIKMAIDFLKAQIGA